MCSLPGRDKAPALPVARVAAPAEAAGAINSDVLSDWVSRPADAPSFFGSGAEYPRILLFYQFLKLDNPAYSEKLFPSYLEHELVEPARGGETGRVFRSGGPPDCSPLSPSVA